MQVLSKDIGDGAILGGVAKLASKTAKLAKKVKVETGRIEVSEVGAKTYKVKEIVIDKPLSVKYDSEVPHVQEPWMKVNSLSAKQKELLHGKELYGKNPGNVVLDKDILKIDTELPGGEKAARECFKDLTDGIEPPLVVPEHYKFTKPDGTVITFRPLGKSGHPKVEIKGKTTNKIHEKITFK